MKQKVTAVFDIGRTNKKFFLFDDTFKEVHREYTRFPEIQDEDGYPTEDLPALQRWLRSVFHRILKAKKFEVEAINFSSYGASFVHLDEYGEVLTPLYNYTKPLDEKLIKGFYEKYGPETAFAMQTGSTNAGMLNSGMQLYWLKYSQPEVFQKIKYALHLPQYLSYIFTGIPLSEYTSIGCHTALWDYNKKDYHQWVYAEELHLKLPPPVSSQTSINMNYNGQRIKIGVGIHDSSAALLPYIRSENKPFILISTGTWSVSLNPFTKGALSKEDIARGCINYMRLDGKPVKAARLFLGQEYKDQVMFLSSHFGLPTDYHKTVKFDHSIFLDIKENFEPWFAFKKIAAPQAPEQTTIKSTSFEYAYHHLLMELVELQVDSIKQAMGGGTTIDKLFLDGGFSDNDTYVQLLSHRFRDYKLRTTHSSLGSALGAAIAISDTALGKKFLKKIYGLKKNRPFIIDKVKITAKKSTK
jgi:sugar (pentulose or hexulose) kinase